MNTKRVCHSRIMRAGIILAGLLILSVSVLPVLGETENRVPTVISITLDPSNPVQGDSFLINGNLTTKTGEPLGNKWVILESTKAGACPGPYGELTTTQTNLDGSFQFYRPPASPPEDLRVVFKGLYGYNSSVSNEISAKQ